MVAMGIDYAAATIELWKKGCPYKTIGGTAETCCAGWNLAA